MNLRIQYTESLINEKFDKAQYWEILLSEVLVGFLMRNK